ncbi:MAG: glycosyltransferase family 4 protein [Colwellia sp.]|nr:glycosyltransferase family 4 protein [Colwellia sp.]
MNILIDIGDFDPKVGASNDMLDLAHYSQHDEMEFFVTGNIDKVHYPIFKAKGLKIISGSSIPFSRLALPIYFFSTLYWLFQLKRFQIDVTHINYISWGPSLAFASKLLKLPIVARAGGEYTLKNKSVKWVSQYVANCHEQASNQLQSPLKPRVNVVGDLVDIDRIARDRIKRSDAFLDTNKVINVVYVGQISERKGLHILVEAFQSLSNNIHLYLVGGDWQATGFPQKIKSMLDNLECKSRVHLINHRTDAVSIINQSDIFILPSLSEARPRVILEAMSLGKCIISTKVGGIPDMISHNETGLLAEGNNVADLSKQLQLATSDDVLRKAMGDNAAVFAEANLSPVKTAINYRKVYQKAINEMTNHAKK